MPRSTINGTAIDLDGKEMILDADQDTTITVDTDDQIDIKIAGSDSLRIKANEIENVSGDLTIDVAGDIILDADGADVSFRDDGTGHLSISNSSNDAVITSLQTDKDMIFKGVDGGSLITALTLDMSDAGAAIFNHDITLDGKITGASQVTQDVNTSSLSVAGGTDSNVGANMTVYGGSHSSLAGVVRFRNGSTETARIDSNGHLILKKNLALDMTTSEGIDFGAAGSSANTLDDYEEGTWTPTITALSSNPTITYDTLRFGYYTKIGRQVIVFGRVRTDAVSGGSGFVKIGGLPFTESGINGDNYTSGGGVVSDTFASNPPHSTMVVSDSNYFYLIYGNYNLVQVSDLANQANANQIQFSLHYITDA